MDDSTVSRQSVAQDEEAKGTTNPASNSLEVKVTFSQVKIPPEEARHFFLENTEHAIRNILKRVDFFLDQVIEGKVSDFLRTQEESRLKSSSVDYNHPEEENDKSVPTKQDTFRVRHDERIAEFHASVQRIEAHLPIMLDLARTRGILEGINGYRSLLIVLLRVLEKVDTVLTTYPFPVREGKQSPRKRENANSGSTSPSIHRDTSFHFSFGALRKWLITSDPFFKQFKVVDVMLATASNLKKCSDDLLQISCATISNEKEKEHVPSLDKSSKDVDSTNESPTNMQGIVENIQRKEHTNKTLVAEDVEEDIAAVLKGLSNEISSFYGPHFGCQYLPNVQTVLKTIVLANASYRAAGELNIPGNNMIPDTAKDLLRGSLSLAYGAYYGLFPEQAAEKYVSTRANADVQEIKNFWNLTEMPLTEKATSILSQSVALDVKIVLPSNKLEFIRKDGSRVFVSPPSLPPSLMMQRNRVDPILPVRARLISYHNVPTSLEREIELEEGPNRSFLNFSKLADKLKEFSPLPDKKMKPFVRTLIIHFHGGGFIAQGVSSHLTYLKQWAKDTGAVILSVDYSLAPEYPYPIAFQECYFAYTWALANCQKLGSTAERVIVVGDSAGGNLAAAITVMAINDGARIPDGLILAYPSLYMHFVTSPSRILSIIDPLLPTETLQACFQAYIPEDVKINTLKNPFLSPGGVTDDILEQFPDKTYILCGAMDPLLDDSIFFAKRLATLRRPVRLQVVDNLPHGILNLAPVPGLGKEMAECVTQISDWINEISHAKHIMK